MQYIWQHIASIISGYDGSMPLAIFLKSFFKRYPKLGSRDRRVLSDMAYSWYRCSKGLTGIESDFKVKMRACLQLCGAHRSMAILQLPAPAVNTAFDAGLLLPGDIPFSTGITKEEWLTAMLTLPSLFLRARKKKEELINSLRASSITVDELGSNCLGLPNGTKVADILSPDAYVVQDASSQAAGNFFKPQPGEYWWDCCAGAGGKSIQLLDMQPTVKLTVSDVRASILQNHRDRCQLYGHKGINYKTVNLANAAELASQLKGRRFNNIICDVPCSGSGTFARSPEQLYFLDTVEQSTFPTLQAQIASNAINYLLPGGSLYYITCSVFRNENEDVVAQLVKNTGMQLKLQHLINGTTRNADSLFVAILEKN